jgi:hypothetical protein
VNAEPTLRELLPDYLLGLLTPDEAARVGDALARSPELRAEADALRAALFALPEALEPEAPAPGSWETLLARVRSERPESPREPAPGAPPVAPRAEPAPAPGRSGGPPPSRRPVLAVALAIALALLVGTAGWGALQQRRADLAAHEEAVIAYWMRDPELKIVPLEAVRGGHPGVACVLPDGRAMVLQPHAPGAGRSYVLYGLTGTGRVELGRTRGRLLLFRADGLKGVELAVGGPSGGVVARADLN